VARRRQEARKGRYEGGGVAVGALGLTGVTPCLWRPRSGTPQHDAVMRAAIALAPLWDPA